MIFIILGATLLFLSPHQVFAITYVVNIPQGTADPKQPIHYIPSEVKLTFTDKVQWYNEDMTTHTVTSGSFQGGPDGLFNSGILEPNDVFVYQPTKADIGKLSYYCTLHPWMNGIITVMDSSGLPSGRIAETGSLQAAQKYVEDAKKIANDANGFGKTGSDIQAATFYIKAGLNYHNGALEYTLLNQHENAAKFYHEAGSNYNSAAIHFEKVGQLSKAVIYQHQAGIEYHFSGVEYDVLDDQKNASLRYAESLMHKGMAKFGSDYVLPPKHQLRWISNPVDIICREGLEIVLKSSTKEPVCVNSASIQKLIERNWAIRP